MGYFLSDSVSKCKHASTLKGKKVLPHNVLPPQADHRQAKTGNMILSELSSPAFFPQHSLQLEQI